jgi:hypothetical protein
LCNEKLGLLQYFVFYGLLPLQRAKGCCFGSELKVTNPEGQKEKKDIENKNLK